MVVSSVKINTSKSSMGLPQLDAISAFSVACLGSTDNFRRKVHPLLLGKYTKSSDLCMMQNRHRRLYDAKMGHRPVVPKLDEFCVVCSYCVLLGRIGTVAST
jgi:hypothetical protein